MDVGGMVDLCDCVSDKAHSGRAWDVHTLRCCALAQEFDQGLVLPQSACEVHFVGLWVVVCLELGSCADRVLKRVGGRTVRGVRLCAVLAFR